MKLFRVLVGLGMLFTAAVSYATSVKTDYDKDFDFQKLKTFAFKTQHRANTDPLKADSILDTRIREALRSKLEAEGFQYAPDGNADFLIRYFASQKEKLNVQDLDYGFPRRWRWGFGPDIWTNYYTVGSMMVDFVDPVNKQLIWRGMSSQTISGLNPSDKHVASGVKDLIKHYLKDAREKRAG